MSLPSPTLRHRSTRVRTITSDEELEHLGPCWTDLLEDSASNVPFLSWEWLASWWRHRPRSGRLQLLAVEDQHGGWIGLAPLILAPARPLAGLGSRLEFLGSGLVGSDYLDLILRRGHETASIDALEQALVGSGRSLHLTALRAERNAAGRLLKRLHARGWQGSVEPSGECPYIDLHDQNWSGYLAECSSAQRYAFRRKLRKIEDGFAMEFLAATTPLECAAALETLIRLHNLRWDERGGSDALRPAWVQRFHREFTRFALARGWLRLYVLRLDGRAVAALYGLLHHGVFYFYQSGFDPGYARHSVGLVTMGLVIRAALAEGACEFDMLHGTESYKVHWTRISRTLLTARAYPPGAGGALARRAFEAMRVARRGARRVLAPVRP